MGTGPSRCDFKKVKRSLSDVWHQSVGAGSKAAARGFLHNKRPVHEDGPFWQQCANGAMRCVMNGSAAPGHHGAPACNGACGKQAP